MCRFLGHPANVRNVPIGESITSLHSTSHMS